MKIHIDCLCGCDVLCIEKICDSDEAGGSLYYFNMYRSYDKAGFWIRLKRSWEYFRRGEFAYSDMTVTVPDLNRMISFLVKAKNQK